MSEIALSVVEGDVLIIEASTTVLIEQDALALAPDEIGLQLLVSTTTVVVDTPIDLALEVPFIAGPQGPAGPAGGTYIHDQGVAAEVWTVVHNLGFYPNVTVIDSALSVVEGDVFYGSLNSLTISFAASFSGRATLT